MEWKNNGKKKKGVIRAGSAHFVPKRM